MTEGKPERALAGINFPPIKTREEAANAQQAASAPGDVRKDMEDDIPPVIRSVLEMSHLMTSGHSHYFRATPGYQGGLYYDGKPFCFASGYRDSKRPRDMEDKGNHMKLKDPIVYGCLSLPVTAAYLIELHRNQTFDLHKPLVAYLPSLESKVGPDVTARSILSFTTVLDDKAILRDAKANWRAPLLSLNPCASMQKCVYEPINRFLAGKDTKSLNGKTQRENLALYVGSSKRPSAILRRTPRKASLSHFSVALLIAAVETQLKGQTFEASIRENFFTKAQCHGTGYGPPKLYRDPNEMFYQPTGLALQHQNFRTPVHGGTLDNCGPPVFNASLNMYAPAEDFGKLFLLSLDAIMDAREVLPETEKDDYHFCDFGIEFAPTEGTMCY
ncbi:hypothetical protein AGDE_06064 [Angomonas deanei]|nr:hypothetical protein AGDE_06064 [Angomonas deanei]|eukprot:EPY37869.1 hypothetical protein AGDE_06064 [Angomonas deanei]